MKLIGVIFRFVFMVALFLFGISLGCNSGYRSGYDDGYSAGKGDGIISLQIGLEKEGFAVNDGTWHPVRTVSLFPEGRSR